MRTPITPDSLYQLLPSIHRLRDEGGALRELCEILAREARIIEDDVFRLAESGFIETCPDWLVPYLGDLLGVTGLDSLEMGSVLSGRAEVADVLAWRRRKGTAAVLERIARAVTGWPGKAVEFFQTLAVTQHLSHTRPHGRWTADVRSGDRMALVDGPFDPTPHTVDVRRIEPRRGRHGIPHVGLFLWRLEAYPVELATARPRQAGVDDGRYTVSPLGLPLPLYARGDSWDVDTRVENRHVPAPLGRRELHARLDAHVGASFALHEGSPGNWDPIAAERVVACDLTDWDRPLPDGRIAVDPVLGRIAFAAGTDMGQFRAFSSPEDAWEYEERMDRTLDTIERCPVPTIAATAITPSSRLSRPRTSVPPPLIANSLNVKVLLLFAGFRHVSSGLHRSQDPCAAGTC